MSAAMGMFRIEVPAQYSIMSAARQFHGALDGIPYAGPRFLNSGVHTVVPSPGDARTAVVWTRAAALGFSPFAADTRCRDGD